MNVLILGHGAREYAIAWKVLQSAHQPKVFVLQEHPGFLNLPIQRISWSFINNKTIHLVIIGPEQYLVDGISDQLRDMGIPVFGLGQQAAQLESSKIFAKHWMNHHGIPTAKMDSVILTQNLDLTTLKSSSPLFSSVFSTKVVKVDGLAGGKGVAICHNQQDYVNFIQSCQNGAFGAAGHRVLVEEFLEGEEISLMVLSDGDIWIPLLPCRDYKKRFDGNQGLNTGGMGSVAPVFLAEELWTAIITQIIEPTFQGLKEDDICPIGILYFGLMIQSDGQVKVLEYNARLGDPETQSLLMLLEEDFLDLCLLTAQQRLPSFFENSFQSSGSGHQPQEYQVFPTNSHFHLRYKKGAACTVVLAAKDYPQGTLIGQEIKNIPVNSPTCQVYWGGVLKDGDKIITNGGRIASLTFWAESMSLARERCYQKIAEMECSELSFRFDIGQEFI